MCYTGVARPRGVVFGAVYLSRCPGCEVCGLSLTTDGEAPADRLLGEPLINVLAQLALETLGIKATALYGGKPGDVLARLNDLNAAPVHLLFDGIL